MGLFGLIGSIIGGGSQKKASQQATNAMVGAYEKGIDLQNQQFQQTRADYMPYTQAGVAAIGGYGDLLGVNGAGPQQAGIDALKAGPLYSSLYRTGEEALLQNAAATGGLRGGNTARGLADFGADTLAGVYSNQLGNLYNMANLGLGATGQVAQFGASAANNVTGLLGQIGTRKADNFLTKGGINAANWRNAGNFLDEIGQAAAGYASGLGGMGSLNASAKSMIAANPSIF